MSRSLGDIPPYGGEYGLGISAATVGCGTALGHSGDLPGYAVKAWTSQGSKRSVVVMVNEGIPVGFPISEIISETALGADDATCDPLCGPVISDPNAGRVIGANPGLRRNAPTEPATQTG